MLTPVLLSGGVGSRLWPVSRETHPKQFLPLAGDITMLQETLQRTLGLEASAPLVVCNEEHRFLAAEQLYALKGHDEHVHNGLILEPFGRNTAPAIALAASRTARRRGCSPVEHGEICGLTTHGRDSGARGAWLVS